MPFLYFYSLIINHKKREGIIIALKRELEKKRKENRNLQLSIIFLSFLLGFVLYSLNFNWTVSNILFIVLGPIVMYLVNNYYKNKEQEIIKRMHGHH